MRRISVLSVLLCMIGSTAYSQVLSSVGDFQFIFALSGSTVERRLRDVNGTVIIGANGCDRVVIERTRVDGHACPGYHARITADLTITTVVNNVTFTAPAMVVVDAQLRLTGIPDNAALGLEVVPDTMAVSGDLPFDKPVELAVYSLREQIAESLSVSIPLGGLTRLIESNPFPAEYYVSSYQQGFLYIIEIYAPAIADAPYPPPIFRTGNVFTVSIREANVEALILWALRDSEVLRRFGDGGFPDSAGNINITDANVELCWDAMLVTFTGTDDTGRQRVINWTMQFERSPYGVDIVPVKVTVDGVSQSLPAPGDEYINPVSQAFFGVMRSTGGGTEIIVGTLGLTSITYGEIRPDALIMAGRQW